jgi:hypothetical protein
MWASNEVNAFGRYPSVFVSIAAVYLSFGDCHCMEIFAHPKVVIAPAICHT